MADIGSIWVRLGVKDQNFNRGMQMAEQRVGRFSGIVQKAGPLMTTAFGVAGVAAVASLGKQMVNLQADFTHTMSKVKALTDATDDQAMAMTNLAREMGSKTQFTARQSADAMSFLAMAGLEVKEVLEALPNTLDLAAAGNLDLAQAADIATNVMSAYNLEAKDLTHVNDIIANTATTANTNVQEFAEAFKMVGPIAKSAGLEIEEVATHIGTLANSGIKATMAGTSLRAMISKLVNPTGDAQKTLDRLGITTLDADGNMRRLNDIMQDLHDSGATTADMFEIFDNRAAAAAAVLASAAPTYEQAEHLIRREGTAARIAATQMDNLRGDILKMQSAWQDLMLTLGEAGDSAMRDAVQNLTSLINGIANAIDAVGEALNNPPWTWLREAGLFKGLFGSFSDVAGDINGLLEKLGIIKKEFKETGEEATLAYNKMSVGELMTALSEAKGKGQEGVAKELAGHLAMRRQIAGGAAPMPEPGGGGPSFPLIEKLSKRGREGLSQFDQDVIKLVEDMNDLQEILNREPPEAPDFAEPYKIVNEVLDESLTKISAFKEANIMALDAAEQNAEAWAENIAMATATAGAGLDEFVGELRRVAKETIAIYLAESVAAMVKNAIESTALAPFGWILAPVVAAGAAALGNTLFEKLVPSFATGIDYVPFDMPAMIHKGEAVIPASENRGGRRERIFIPDARIEMREFVIRFREEENYLSRV